MYSVAAGAGADPKALTASLTKVVVLTDYYVNFVVIFNGLLRFAGLSLLYSLFLYYMRLVESIIKREVGLTFLLLVHNT